MKRSTLQSMFRTVAASAVLFVPLGTMVALAQDGPADQAATAVKTTLTPQQLDNMVAPLALYPDPLLSQVLVAATYPLELVEANQWLQQNRALTGTALMDAAKQQNWDPSVQALVAFPDVLTRLNSDVRWTTDLGNAFLGQQADVMAAIQRLRARAKANGKLGTTPQETVTTQVQNGQTQIAIQPADPQVIYVPTYDPTYVWGAPAWGYYPPLFYPTYGFGFGFGIPFGGMFFGWPGWGGYGWGFNWFGGGLFLNGGFFGRYGYHGYGGFAGNRAWAHNYSRASRATGAAGYSRSYNTAANRSAGAARAGAAGYRGGAASANRASAGSAARSYSRSYSSGAARSYSAPSRSYSSSAGRSYSAPASRYSGSARSSAPARSSGGSAHYSGGGGSHGGGGGHSGGGGRR